MADQDKLIAKAKEIKDKSQEDAALAGSLAKDPGEVICGEFLNPQVIASSGEASPSRSCTCLPGFSCGTGCQGLVGTLSGSYGCESGNPI